MDAPAGDRSIVRPGSWRRAVVVNDLQRVIGNMRIPLAAQRDFITERPIGPGVESKQTDDDEYNRSNSILRHQVLTAMLSSDLFAHGILALRFASICRFRCHIRTMSLLIP